MIGTRYISITLLIVLLFNICYFIKVYHNEEKRLRLLELQYQHTQNINNFVPDDEIEFPDLPYEELAPNQKISFMLKQVQDNNDNKYWLVNTTLKHSETLITPNTLFNSTQLYYDPRTTLSIYLSEIQNQLQRKNPENDPTEDDSISVPFSWADWVDLTALNSELAKPEENRLTCSWLQSAVNKPTNFPDFCKDANYLTEEEIASFGVDEAKLPGFIVKESPRNKIPNLQSIMQGKSHLLTYAEIPLKIIFLTHNGTYEVNVNEREDMIQSGLLQGYLDRGDHERHSVIGLSPQREMSRLTESVTPRHFSNTSGVFNKPESNYNSTELHLSPELFHYGQDQVDNQIIAYETRLQKNGHQDIVDRIHPVEADPGPTEEELFNELELQNEVVSGTPGIYMDGIGSRESPEITTDLSRSELNHYTGLVAANSCTTQNEPTYYKLATLLQDEENDDNGWHYEWRFFDGAFRYVKDESWSTKQLELREQIILDRLLRNWFKFSREKGILSWISHGPLLAWYWNGFMFPFDIDIDIQMPIAELNRLSKDYNMTLVVEDVNEGYGKYLIDCSTYLHHRDVPGRDNYIDARFIDVDSGVYIDITGLSKNNESPPHEYSGLIKEKKEKGESLELYMDRRKHWLNFEKLSPLRYSMLDGVPVYVPNDIMSMLNYEYSQGTTSYYYGGYYFVPKLRLWLKEDKLMKLLNEKDLADTREVFRTQKLIKKIKQMTELDKVRFLESDDEVLVSYYQTQKFTGMHELEKTYLLDWTQQLSVLDLNNNPDYNQLSNRFELGKPLKHSLYEFEYYERSQIE